MPDLKLDDPSEIYTSLKSAWKSFKSKTTKLTNDAIKSVEVWREAESVILPVHPFSLSIDTNTADGLWRDRTSLFVPQVKNLNNRVRHGFNKSGQIVIAERKHFSTLVIQRDDAFDVAGVRREADETYSVMPTRPHYVRYNLDDQSRIISIWDYSPTEDDDLHIELFEYKKDRLVQTHLQRFDSGKDFAGWMEDLPPEKQATLYRQVNKKYREFLPSRAVRRFQYDKDGTLESVNANQLHLPDHVDVIYTRSHHGTLEETFNKLVPLLTKDILAALKKAKKSHPLRGLALLYSAEHIHTGLPYALATVPADAEHFEALEIEAYSVPIEWPTRKLALQKAINQFIIAVESSPKYRNSRAPRPHRELLWQVSLNLTKELLATKIADKQLTILPIDDHGDIEPHPDFLDCVAKADRKYFPRLSSTRTVAKSKAPVRAAPPDWKPCRYIDYRDGCHGIMYYGKGGGYNWHAVVEYLVRSRHPDIVDAISYDPESSMFVARSEDINALYQVAQLIKELAGDSRLFTEALSKAKKEIRDDVD